MTFNSGENGHSGIIADKPMEQELCMWRKYLGEVKDKSIFKQTFSFQYTNQSEGS